jgi:hypothetical protein
LVSDMNAKVTNGLNYGLNSLVASGCPPMLLNNRGE